MTSGSESKIVVKFQTKLLLLDPPPITVDITFSLVSNAQQDKVIFKFSPTNQQGEDIEIDLGQTDIYTVCFFLDFHLFQTAHPLSDKSEQRRIWYKTRPCFCGRFAYLSF